MKKGITLIVYTMLSALLSSAAFCQWQTLYPNMSKDVETMYFIDCNTGWIAGEDGYMKKTTNGGANWVSVTTGTTKDIKNVFFIDAQTGWFVGKSGIIRKTTDGGTSWVGQNSGVSEELNAVHFIDGNTGYAAGKEGTILRTTDGGSTWSQSSLNTGSSDLKSVLAISSTTVYIGGKNGILVKSTDGGINWSWISTQTSETLESLSYSLGYVFACYKYGMTIKVSSSGSVTHIHSGTGKDLNSIHFIKDTQIGWVAGEEGRAYYTTNGGVSWSPNNVSTSKDLIAIQFLSPTCGYAADEDGKVYKLSGTVSIEDITPGGFKIYPNPVHDHLTIRNASMIESVAVYTASGQLVHTIHAPGMNPVISLSHLESGTYLLQIETENGIGNHKIVKQ